jgi:prefoldin subunit 5
MATKTVDELLIQISLNAKQLQQSLSNAEQSINKFADKISGVMSTALDLIALKFSVSFGKNLVETFANTGSKLYFLSQQVGESVGTLDKWGAAVQKAGGNAESFYGTINSLHNKLVDMKYNGDMKTAGMFGMLGVKTSNADHSLRNTTDILLDLSDKLKGKDKGFQQFVGRQFGIDEATLRVLSQGREATLKLVNAQKQLYNEKTAREAEKQREKLIDFERALDKLKIQIAEKLLPAADKFINWIQKFVTQHGKDLALIVEGIVNGLIDLIKYLPEVTKFFTDLNKTLGVTAGDLGKILAGLLALKVGKDILGTLGLAATALSSPIVAAVAAVTSLYEAWQMLQDKMNNPDKFNEKMQNSIDDKSSLLNRGLKWFSDHTGLNMTPSGNQKTQSSMWDKALDWAQGMVESSNKDNTIGYKMKKDANGKYQPVLDAKGQKIPEAYGRYQIKPSTASEVMGRNVTGQELLNGEFNQQVHDKYMMQLEKRYGSKEAALAAYNGDLANYRKTGHSDYVDKIKAKLGGAIPANLASQPVQLAVNQANQANQVKPAMTQQAQSGATIQTHTVNIQANNPKQLASAVVSKVNLAFAFAGNPRVA